MQKWEYLLVEASRTPLPNQINELYSNGEKIFSFWAKEYKGQRMWLHDYLMKLGAD